MHCSINCTPLHYSFSFLSGILDKETKLYFAMHLELHNLKNIVDCIQHTNPVNIKEYSVLAKTLVLASKAHITSILE